MNAMGSGRRFIVQTTAFVVVTAVGFALEVLLLIAIESVFGRRIIPRGLGWVVGPFAAGLGVARFVGSEDFVIPSRADWKDFADRTFWSWSTASRVVATIPVLWSVAVVGYVVLFDAYGYSMDSREWWHMMKVIAFPPTILLAGYWLVRKVV